MSDTQQPQNVPAPAASAPAEPPAGTVEPVVPAVPPVAPGTPEPAAAEPGSAPLGEKGTQELIRTRQRAQNAEQENAVLRQLIEKFGQPAAPQGQQTAEPAKPTPDQFATWEEYENANEQFLIDKATRSVMTQMQQVTAQQQQQTMIQQIETGWQTQLEAAAVEDPTIFSIIDDQTLPIPQHVGLMIKRSDVGVKVLRHLDQNRAEADRIARMHPLEAAMAIGRIEASIKATPAAQPPRQVSMAPAPVAPLNTVGSPVVDENTMSTEDWIMKRNREKLKKN